jgi:hypothetical protein
VKDGQAEERERGREREMEERRRGLKRKTVAGSEENRNRQTKGDKK